jgi:SAM-dependent methyltransferase
MRELIPWWGRIAVKIVLSRLPARYDMWRRLNVFRHGAMHRSDYALGVFQNHFARARIPAGRDFVALELGPGDSLLSAVIAAAYGARHTYLVDAGPFATTDVAIYQDTARYLRARGLEPPELDRAQGIDSVLQMCRASYVTRGLQSLREIPAASVDFIWSHAVLEHIRRHEFLEFVRETRRIVRDGGVCSHQIDLQDHLGGALNNLRISSRWWEAEWMARSGFYTNRLRMSEIVGVFESAGFTVSGLHAARWEALPTQPRALAREFQSCDTAELLVKSFDIVLSPS